VDFQEKYSYAHRATNLKHWHTATQPYEIQYEWTFEPYILGLRGCMLNYCFMNRWIALGSSLRCAGLPPYPQVFQYYGNDKISWVYHVAVWGAR
jgi:hypothetical protein